MTVLWGAKLKPSREVVLAVV